MSTLGASACTSSGSAWSRPSSAASAFAALSSISPARGLAPSSVRGSRAGLLEYGHDVAAQRLARVHAAGGVLSGEHLADRGHRLQLEHAVALRVHRRACRPRRPRVG